MAIVTKIGNIFVASDLEIGVKDTLAAWMPTYMKDLEIQRSMTPGQIVPPKTYTNKNDFAKFPEEALPMVVVISPGVAGRPEARGDGQIDAWFSIGIGIICSANTSERADFIAKFYGASAMAIMLQQPVHGGIGYLTEFNDMGFEAVPVDAANRYVRSARLSFSLLVENVVRRFDGPIGNPSLTTIPGSNWGSATLVDAAVIRKGP